MNVLFWLNNLKNTWRTDYTEHLFLKEDLDLSLWNEANLTNKKG